MKGRARTFWLISVGGSLGSLAIAASSVAYNVEHCRPFGLILNGFSFGVGLTALILNLALWRMGP